MFTPPPWMAACPPSPTPPGAGTFDRPLGLVGSYPFVTCKGGPRTYEGVPRSEQFFWYASKNLGLLISTTQRSGASGKFRIGFDGANREYGVKEFRLVSKPGVNWEGYPKTRATLAADIFNEACTTQYLRQGIEASTRHLDAPEGLVNWAKFRPETDIYRLFDIAVCEQKQKAYVVGPRDLGSLLELQEHLSPALDSSLALSTAVQLSVEAAALHEVMSYAHLDISAGNCFYNGRGRVRLMDFGNAQPLLNLQSAWAGVWGTIAAPEMVTGALLGAATDAFSLGILIFALGARAHHYSTNPFLIPPAATAGGVARRHRLLSYTFEQFWAWKRCHQNDAELIVATEIVACAEAQAALGTADPFTRFFLPLTRGSPELSEVLLNSVLVKERHKRCRMSELASYLLLATCQGEEHYNQHLLRKVMAGSDALVQKPYLLNGLRHFRKMQYSEGNPFELRDAAAGSPSGGALI